jgi:hypothetical protein
MPVSARWRREVGRRGGDLGASVVAPLLLKRAAAWERGDGELRPMSQVPLGDLHNKSEAPTLP